MSTFMLAWSLANPSSLQRLWTERLLCGLVWACLLSWEKMWEMSRTKS